MLEMQLWVQSDNPDYKEAVKKRLAELRAKAGAEKKRIKAERVELRALLAKAATKAAKEFGATLRERRKCRAKKRENVAAFAVRLGHCADSEQLLRDLFDGLLSLVPREKSWPVFCASPPKEEGGLSDSEFWNGYEWEKD